MLLTDILKLSEDILQYSNMHSENHSNSKFFKNELCMKRTFLSGKFGIIRRPNIGRTVNFESASLQHNIFHTYNECVEKFKEHKKVQSYKNAQSAAKFAQKSVK